MSTWEESIHFEVWTPNLSERVWVGDPESFSFTFRHNQQPSGSLTLPGDHRTRRRLNVEGCRYRFYYQDEFGSSGVIRSYSKQGVGHSTDFSYTLIDDWRLFTRMIGLPVPGAAGNNQGAAEYHRVSGPAETAVKDLLTANLTRTATVGLPVTVTATAGRGTNVTIQTRWQKIADKVFPVADLHGVGFTVRHLSGAGLTVDAYAPVTWPIRMSEDAGTIIASTYTRSLPEVTRVYVGAGGDGTSRVTRGPFINTDAETRIHDWIEDFVDARDINPADANLEALIAERAQDALAAGSFRAGISLDLAETPNYLYGGPKGVHVGDRIPYVLEPQDEETTNAQVPVLTDVLRSATLSLTPSSGLTVTPVIGDRTDDPDEVLNRSIATVARRQRTKAGEA